MLDFSDKPYRYFPPRRSPVASWILGLYNRFIFLPQRSYITAIQVSGEAQALAQQQHSKRLLFLPNHPTHCDSQIYFEALRRIGVSTLVMASYDGFLPSRIDAHIMQRLGAFSVDREGSDSLAMQQALTTLTETHHALTIFPEGNVYLQNDQVTPFHEGAALIGLRGAQALASQDMQVLAVPVSIKVTYLQDVQEQLQAKLYKLSEELQLQLHPDASPLEQIHQIGQAALLKNLRQRGIENPAAETLNDLIEQAAEKVITHLEQKMELKARRKDTLIKRIRRARRAIHQIRLDNNRVGEHTVAVHWADQAMLALRIVSYNPGYVESAPTIDRYAETIEKLAEDIYGQVQKPLSKRQAYVHFGRPIDLTEYLESFDQKALRAVQQFTELCEERVQEGLDHLNSNNPHPGALLWKANKS